MIKNIWLLPLLFFIFSSCASSSSGGVSANSDRMPSWVNDVYSFFDRDLFVAASGFGKDRAQAEANALSSLASFFGQSIEVERTAASLYQQAIVNGVMESWVDTAEMKTNIKTVSSIDNLIGAEIKEVWFDSKDTYYAAAVLEKAAVIRIYSQLLDANNNVISNLMRPAEQERNLLQSVMRLYFAETLAKVNELYRKIIWLLGGKTNDTVVGPLYYRTEAMKIISQNPISIRVSNDRNGRISLAFEKALAGFGFHTTQSGTRSRYALEVDIALSPVNLPDNRNVFSRIELSARLRDTNLNQILIPYSFNSREGHTTQADADNRCYAAAEKNINDVFKELLSDYLMQLRPKT